MKSPAQLRSEIITEHKVEIRILARHVQRDQARIDLLKQILVENYGVTP